MTKWKALQSELDEAGITEPGGKLSQPWTNTSLSPPTRVELHGNLLLWSHKVMQPQTEDDRTYRESRARPTDRMLEEFVRLAAAPPHRILVFAQRWGVLGICDHGLPTDHNPPEYSVTNQALEWEPRDDDEIFVNHGCEPLLLDHCQLGKQLWRLFVDYHPERGWWYAEPIEPWYRYASLAAAILRAAAHVHKGELLLDDDHQVLGKFSQRGYDPVRDNSVLKQRDILVQAVNEWLALGNAQLWLSWYGVERPMIVFTGRLFANIGIQLMRAVSLTSGFYLCSSCGAPYLDRKRQPHAGKRNYCQDCKYAKRDQRDARRDSEARKKERAKRDNSKRNDTQIDTRASECTTNQWEQWMI